MSSERAVRQEAYVEKARGELAALAERGLRMGGNAFSPILVTKGELTDAEREGAEPFSGRDGSALRKSFERLGYEPEEWCWALIGTGPTSPVGELGAALVQDALAALDPATLVCCDEAAASAIRQAYADDLVEVEDLDEASLAAGKVVVVRGMRVLNLGGFEAALDDPRQKQVMWSYLKKIPPLSEPF